MARSRSTRPGPGLGAGLQVGEVEDAVRRMRDDGVGHALLADERGQRARVDARHGDDAAPLQPLVEIAACAIVRRAGDVGLEHRADRAVPRGRRQIFVVLVIGADIADMREGEGDDLAGIGRVGEDLLVAGQRRVEADFGDGTSGGAEAATLDDRTVGKHQKGGRLFGGPGGSRSWSWLLSRERGGFPRQGNGYSKSAAGKFAASAHRSNVGRARPGQ